MSSLERRIASLQQHINALQQFVPHKQLLQTGVSQASVGWHLQHAALVLQNIMKALQASDPNTFQPRRSFWKTVVLNFGRIPRGRARAPKGSIPPQLHDSHEAVITEINHALGLLPSLNQLSHNAHFMHPVFGPLNLREAIALMKAHTHHHVLIIRDIISAAAKAQPV